jgi:hypothetical protein
MSIDAQLPPRLERYELKYVIPSCLVEPVSDYVLAYCGLDRHSEAAEDNFYRVNSLYFDSPNFLFLRNRMYGKDNRFNMRVRSYGWDALPPYFLEIKQKKANVVIKYRATLSEGEWPGILNDPTYQIREDETSLDSDNKSLFLRLATSYAAEPKILTQYRRRAFASVVDDYARVTMDMDMRCYYQEAYNLLPDPHRMVPYDDETIYDWGGDPGNSVILEIKCHPTQVPTWVLDLTHHFQLYRRSFSKYKTSLLSTLSRDSCPDIGERYSSLYT